MQFGDRFQRGDDRLLDFSRAVSGAYYFAPSLTTLTALADAEEE